MGITQKQRTKIAQKQRTHSHLQDYCAEYLYATHITEQQTQNLMHIHDSDADVLRRTFFIADKMYIIPAERTMYAKTIQHGWSISPWSSKKTPKKSQSA